MSVFFSPKNNPRVIIIQKLYGNFFNGEVKLSFRSTGNFAVNKFASDHFEGGGHKNASGGISYLSLDATIEKFKALAIDFKEKYRSP